MKLNRVGSFIVLGLALMVILSQSASIGVKAQVNGSFAASLSQQPKTQNPTDQAPYKITVQGRLTDPSGNPITSQVNVSFKLYNVASGGSAIFSEGPVAVTPDNRGLLTYQLGSTSVISTELVSEFAGSLFLGLTVGSDNEMSPRILLTASPYALSLAPGTVVQGAYATNALTTSFGVINGINLDRTTFSNSGLYGKGTTGVYGEADPSGGFGSIAGNFVDSGGYAGNQFGISAISNSNNGHDGYGGFFGSYGGGNGNQYGVYALAGASAGSQQEEDSAGVVGISTANSSSDTSAGGIFTSTNTYHSQGAIGYGTTGVQGVGSSTSSYPSIGGSFIASGSGANVLGVNGNATASGNHNATGVQGYASGGASPYGGYFHSTSAGIGMYSYADQPGLAAQLDTNDSNGVALVVLGRIHATSCCSGADYDIQVRYHGSEPLHAGDVLAMDGVNETVNGTPTLGVVKATAANANAAVGVAQYPVRKSITTQDGQDVWKADTNATSIAPGELATAVVLGQVSMKVTAKVGIGDRLTLDDAGAPTLASKGADNVIGKVASQPDKDGYVTVFVNLK